MSDWDGTGLPPVARARANSTSRVRTSLMTTAGTVSAETAGLTPIGDVLGCVVERVMHPLGAFRPTGDSGNWLSRSRSFSGPLRNYTDAVRHGFSLARDRLELEAAALGADGVIDIYWATRELDGFVQEFLALGTAVRAETRHRPGSVFTTHLSGQDTAKLLLGGWVPVRMVLGIGGRLTTDRSLDVRIRPWEETLAKARSLAREDFHAAVAATGADGAIVDHIATSSWEIGENLGLAAVGSMFGTAIARFHSGRAAPTRTLTMLPLTY